MKKDIMKKVPYILAAIRLGAFIPLIFSSYDKWSIKIKEQIFLVLVIAFSDIYDGKISRKYNEQDMEKLCFRLTDTVIDKTGIFLCMKGLQKKDKISHKYYNDFIKYSILLLGAGIFNLMKNKNKDNELVEANVFSRSYTALTGVSLFLYNNRLLNEEQSNKWANFMMIMGTVSLTTQACDKFINNSSDKGVKKYESNRF